MTLELLDRLHRQYKMDSLRGRYINLEMIMPLYDGLSKDFKLEVAGKSVLENPIHTIKWGSGNTRILIWSQMHGNESTTTKALFDLFNALSNQSLTPLASRIQICCIPMLNPDGANTYTRLNANEIDLNRDAQDLSQPESRVLRAVFEQFNPDYCFNLHGQRTLYSAGSSSRSAVLSFLSPAADEQRSINESRKKSMALISDLFKQLTPLIPGQISLYNDAYNANCVGDTFQGLNVPSVLFEAGHYPQDYQREITRSLIFKALVISLKFTAYNSGSTYGFEIYKDIPQNEERFFDILIRHGAGGKDIGIRYKEVLNNKKIDFIPVIEKMESLGNYFGHREIQANGHVVLNGEKQLLNIDDEVDIVLINDEIFSLKLADS